MSQGQLDCWTVVPASGTLTPQLLHAFTELRDERGLPPAQEERIPSEDGSRVHLRTNFFRLAVWNNEAEAQDFATELVSRTRSQWNVVQTHCDPD
jgi:hypothetical protein